MDNNNVTVESKNSSIKKYIISGIVGLLLIAVIVLLVFGFKTLTVSKLNCSSSSDNNGIKIEQKYEISYDKDSVNNVTKTMKFEYSNQTLFNAFKAVTAPGTDATYSALENKNIKYESSTKDKTFSFTLQVDVKNASKEDVSATGLNKSLKTLKADLESKGLVCK